ncbi:LOW QUALITY PROTEIN: stigma-specific STIG1-like protein 2 [Phalaenopsis equestris]|uniref:LOW QUALITY PROTEIN: stigma-specific STIG1-like protein 2 n=1 Tax=Phalaenopsis equestris TaxID=78828 RepID=UPI0009E34F7C|nr:LOW QUALITY PROTEIN: stigma-specific STIG1-like protein 2 [Phalaenopsis equestris]
MSFPFLQLSITILSLLSIISPMQADYADLVNKHFINLSPRAGSRLLAHKSEQLHHHCFSAENTTCPAETPRRKQNEQLTCCRNRCRDILSDRNNCGLRPPCGHKCGFGELCCNGMCAAVAYDVRNCGACGRGCKHKLRGISCGASTARVATLNMKVSRHVVESRGRQRPMVSSSSDDDQQGSLVTHKRLLEAIYILFFLFNRAI